MHRSSYYVLAYEEYNRNYDAISKVVNQSLGHVTATELNKITADLSKTLILHDLKKNIFFFLWKFIQFIGGVPLFLFFLIIPLALIIKMFKEKNWEPSYPQLFLSMIFLITFLNAGVVAVFETNSVAYFCYSQFMLYCLGVYFVGRVFFIFPGESLELNPSSNERSWLA